MEYKTGQIYNFEVITEFGDNEDFFRFRLPGIGEGRMPKLKFQKREPLPSHMQCRVKYINDGIPVLSHYMPMYVNRFYGQGALHGREYPFTVFSVPARPGDPYVLEDSYGMRFKLHGNESDLTPGQEITCRFTSLTNSYFSLERTRDDMRVTFISADTLLDKIGLRGILRSHVLLAMRSLPQLADACVEHDHSNARWVINALQGAVDAIADSMRAIDLSRHHRYLHGLIDAVRHSALYLIEGSRFLRNQPEGVRSSLQARITAVVEAIEPFTRTLCLFRDSRQVGFVEDMLSKLRESGYLYHPGRQFAVLMAIMRADPSLVTEYLGRLFDTIMEWNLDTWTAEPFRSAFVGQFEIYIRHASAQVEALPQADSQADKDLLEKIVTAVALQTLIGGDDDPDRSRRNRALLYRCIALLRPAAADALLDKAFLTLNGAHIPVEYKYDHIRQPLMLMTRAMVPPAPDMSVVSNGGVFTSGNIAVTVGPEGVSVRRTDESADGRALPAGLIPWQLGTPQVYLDNIPPISAGKLGNLDAHRRLWSDIETALTESRTVAEVERPRVKADVDDEVLIVINPDQMSGTDDPVWVARIDDDNYLPGNGTIRRSDIIDYALRAIDINYNPRMARECFIDSDGRPRHFVARVTAIDADGGYRFSMADDVDNQRDELINYSNSYLAVITQRLDREYRSITDTGYGFYLRREEGDPDYKPGTNVVFRPLDLNNPSHMVGTIICTAADGEKVEKLSAFRSLMTSICLEQPAPAQSAAPADSAEAEDQTLSVEDMRELIEIYRYKALSSSAILAAYDYLLFARTLALALGDARLADSLRLHASLLRLHQFYATNSRIDADELETYRSRVQGNPLLEIMFRRLETVSWLGKPETCAELWQRANNPRNELEDKLARMVLAYNMLPEGQPADDPIARGLKAKIAALLGVNFERPNLKSYGRENQFVEFKSSIVYPARKNKTDKVEADPARQQRVILKIIASFINSSGGTLYIGVNDASRCAAGLFEDFEYYKHRRAQIGTHYFDIKTPDNMCVFLENLVRDTWGSLVAGSVQIRIDDEAERDVIIVEVQPRTLPVKLDDKIYVRRSSSSVPLTADETAEFMAERQALDAREQAARRQLAPAAETAPATESAPAAPAAETAATAPETIPTSAWRPNVLHSYEDNFVAPAGYIYLTADDSVQFSRQDMYLDTDPTCRLTLAYTPDEAAQGFLIAVYDDLRVLKVPLQEIIEKDENRPYTLLRDARPIFVTVAMPGQGLLTILTDSRNNMYRRVTGIADIESSHLNGTPARITDRPVADTVRCELAAASAMPHFRYGLAGTLGPRQIGYALKCALTSPAAENVIKKETASCQPHV